MKKSLSIVFFVSAIMMSMTLLSCGDTYKSIKRMQQMEEGVSSPTTKEELKEAIEKYDRRAIDLVTTQAQEGIWWKILGTRYLDEEMYSQAYECFQKAVSYYPDNANLYFYLAVCAGYIANSTIDWNVDAQGTTQEIKLRYLRVSEESYQRALAIDPKYYRAMYGIGVLYVFALEESDKAIPYLENFLSVQTKDTDGMFVLARAYYDTMLYEKAIAVYDRIIELKPSAQKVADAEANKKIVTDAMYSN